MKEHIKRMAEEAGFMLWADEAWNPGDVIDWGSRYDAELEKFAELVRQRTLDKCAQICFNLADLTKPCPTGDEFKYVYVFAGDKIRELKFNEDSDDDIDDQS